MESRGLGGGKTVKYKIGYTQDQLRYTPACALDSKVPLGATKELLASEADEICPDDTFRLGESVIRMTGSFLEIEGREGDAEKVLAQLRRHWEVKRMI